MSMSLFNDRVDKLDAQTRSTILATLIEPFKKDFDYIFVDTPPSMSAITNNALFAADYVTAVVQTQRASYHSSIQTLAYYNQFKQDYGAHYDFLGAILYLFASGGTIDNSVVSQAKDFFGDAMFVNRIYHRERVKRWAEKGIKLHKPDSWDKRTASMYKLVTNTVMPVKTTGKYTYHIIFTRGYHICRKFIRDETILIQNLLIKHLFPIRLGRQAPRKLRVHYFKSFLYRIA